MILSPEPPLLPVTQPLGMVFCHQTKCLLPLLALPATFAMAGMTPNRKHPTRRQQPSIPPSNHHTLPARLCPRAHPSFRDQAETLSAAHPHTSLYSRFLCQVLLHPSFVSQGKSTPQPDRSDAHMTPSYHRRQSSGTGDTLLKQAVTCC